jgi:long-chain acyl-CoA synthetase
VTGPGTLPASFAGVLRARAASSPEAPFVIAPESGATLGYGALEHAAWQLGRTLDEAGIERGGIVGFMLPNGIAAASAFVATMAAGRVVAPFNLLAQDSHLDFVLDHAKPSLVFASGEHAARLEQAVARSGAPTRVVTVDADSPDLAGAAAPAAVGGRARGAAEDAGEGADAPAMLMYTSGTTGMPKGVLLTHANMLHAGRAVAAHHGLDAGDRVLSSLPLYHINGQCIATVSTLCAGGSAILPRRFSSSQWWNQVERFRPTWLNLVPTIVAYLLNGPDLTPAQREAAARVRFARSASAPLPPEQQRAFEERFGIPIVEAMGLTESASIAFCNPMDRAKRRVGSPGRPLGVEARVVGRDGAVLGDGERGEIEIRGASVMRGYYRAPELTAATLREGWLATGDLGYRDADGFYFITGRSKELIIKGGENIAPREIDEALLRHPAVLEAAAVGVPDAAYGQEILACVVVKPGTILGEEELRDHCVRELGRYKSPRYFRFVDELPKGPSGKVQRMRLTTRL